MRKLVIGCFTVAVFAAAALPAEARTQVDFHLSVAPPVTPYELVPAPRAGFVWAPGYHDWRYGRYIWVAGHWVRHRPGYYYEPVRWVQRGGRYYRAGGWRDADRDGVPNYADRAPHNPYYR